MVLLTALLGAPALACPVRVVEPDDPSSRAIGTSLGGVDVARGSLVLPAEADCPAGQEPVRVLAANTWYRGPAARVGDVGCVDDGWLGELGGRALVVQDPPDGPAVGLPHGAVVHLECGADGLRVDGEPVGEADVATLRPIAPEHLAAVRHVQAAYVRSFGEVGLEAIPWTDWGYVGLPLTHRRTDAEVRAAWEAEALRTEEQREKAVTELGAPVGEGWAYAHFTGSDPRWTDLWGRPETLVFLLDAAAAWHARCLELAPPGAPRACTLQVGDIAWYNDRVPDPLGHATHRHGRCIDLRLPRDDGSWYEAWWNRPDDREGAWGGCDRDLTGALVAQLVADPRVGALYYNDPSVVDAVEAARAVRGHDDHVHVCVTDTLHWSP